MSKKPPAAVPPPMPNRMSPSERARLVPGEATPSPDQRSGNYVQQIFTYTTKPGGTHRLYNGDQQWVKVTLELETAGPVVVGTSQTLTPVLSGKGKSLPTGQAREFILARGNILWIASTSINRVGVVIEQLPWFEQLLGAMTEGPRALIKFLSTRRAA